MIRDLAPLTARTHDLLVVGGGVYGLTIACDAAQRGLRVALVERNDFGCGNSFNHLRTIHGGLRYLQTLDVRRARESVRERRTLARIAPHAVKPMSFVLPLRRSLLRGKAAMRAGLLLDRLVAGDRNRGVQPSLWLPAGRVVGRDEAIERYPGLHPGGLTGAVVWSDYVTVEADRLTFSWALAAAGHGAVLANHVEATSLISTGGRVSGVRAVDRLGGRSFEVGATLTVNAAGSAVNALATQAGARAVPLLQAMNLVTRRDAPSQAVGARSAQGRHLFLVPWRGRALFGTWEGTGSGAPGDTAITGDEIAQFIAELNTAFPALGLTVADVTLVHRGAVPAGPAPGGGLEGHERIIDHAAAGHPGLISVAGAKYTTARAVAERVVDRVLSSLRLPPVASRTAHIPLPGGDLDDVDAAVKDAHDRHGARLPRDVVSHLVAVYGSYADAVAEFAASSAELSARVGAAAPVVAAQLAWAARHEMAVTLEDAVVRRTPLGALGYPGDGPALHAANVVGSELGWSDEQKERQMDALRAFYGNGARRTATAPGRR